MQYQYSQRSPVDELSSMFPGADREIVRSLFMANNNNFEKTKAELAQLTSMSVSHHSRQGSYQGNTYSNSNSTSSRSYNNNYDGSELAGQYQASNSYGGSYGGQQGAYGGQQGVYGGQQVSSMSSNNTGSKKKTGFVKKLKCGFAGLVQKGKKGILTDSANYNEIDEDM